MAKLPITDEEACERLGRALEVLGNKGPYSNGEVAVRSAMNGINNLIGMLLARIDGIPPESLDKHRIAPNRHLLRLTLTDEELTGLQAMKRACKTTLSDEDFAQFVIREHLYRKGFHP